MNCSFRILLLIVSMMISFLQRRVSCFILQRRVSCFILQPRARIAGSTVHNVLRRSVWTSGASTQGPPFFRRISPKRYLEAIRVERFLEAPDEVPNTPPPEKEEKFDLTEGISKQQIEFRTGLPIMVEVLSFGPMGASVAVLAKSHNPEDASKVSADHPLASGIIYQSEIHYFREMRRNVDVVLGEVLPAYVERVRYDGKIDVALRVIGGRAKVDQWSATILERLEEFGELNVGNKSSPQEIAREFPGMSKSDFKKIIGALFERRKLYPFPYYVYPYREGLALKKAENELRGIKPNEEERPRRRS